MNLASKVKNHIGKALGRAGIFQAVGDLFKRDARKRLNGLEQNTVTSINDSQFLPGPPIVRSANWLGDNDLAFA